MIKPDAIGRRLCGEIIRRYESKGLRLAALKIQVLSRSLAERQYAEHEGKPFYTGLLDFMTSGPSIQMVWEGESAVEMARRLNGVTDGREADLGTIRGDFAVTVRKNLVHASDSRETADREIALFFEPEEICDYPMPDGHWLKE